MKKYDFKAIEAKWQKAWEKANLYKAKGKGKKFYSLIEFPYPSGDGLHVGHVRSNTAMDIVSRKRRMEGFDVLYPIGWDAFGLPTENYAIKTGVDPAVATKKNTDTFRRQLKALGFSFDWSREINTTDPGYYKWTQWMFLQFFKKGLAYKAASTINWCPKDKIGLANEEAVGGICDRCGSKVEKRMKEQWMLRITAYADKLLEGLKDVDYIPQARVQQENWIGRSEGAEISFPLSWLTPKMEVVFATNNEGKRKRMQKLFAAAGLGITLKTPTDIGIHDFNVLEDGATLAENAEKKARTLAAKTDLPVFADDTGFFLGDVELNPITVKRNALKGADEKKIGIEGVARRMQQYYQKIASSRGGKVDAEWRNALCFVTPEKFAVHVEAIRPVILTNELHGNVDPYLPLRGLYIAKATGKYALEQTETEEMRELQPIVDGIKKLFTPAITVFTTRPDTLFGATYVVLAPEHPFVTASIARNAIKNTDEVQQYVDAAGKKTDEERLTEGKEKTGVELKGVRAINPANKEEIPIYVADYVLSSYGTGAIMAVPAHDERDFEFAKKFNLPIRKVIQPAPIVYAIRNARDIASGAQPNIEIQSECWAGDGILINSGTFNDLPSEKARWAIVDFVHGTRKTQYKLRDWVFSRQRYWGEPIPLIHCEKCGWVPVSDKDLPVKLPKVKNYKPRDDGQSPLASVEKWVNVKCPQCKGPAKRETDTMPNWAGSSWYFLRYTDPKNKKEFASKKALKYFTPVDWYNGGMEHTVLHLLYSRFWNRFLYDQKLVPTAEPYKKRTSHGLILAAGGVKMSKSKGNVVNPDDIVKNFGADALRLYEMFIGPFDQPVAWDERGVVGTSRFLERVWRIYNANATNKETNATNRGFDRLLHQTVKKVTEDIESMSFNTAVSALMILLNAMEKYSNLSPITYHLFLKLLAPFAPHITEELWAQMGNKKSIHLEKWPTYDPKLLVAETFTLVIQVNGKTRDTVEVPVGISESDAKTLAFGRDKVHQALAGATPKKTIYVPGRLISFVL